MSPTPNWRVLTVSRSRSPIKHPYINSRDISLNFKTQQSILEWTYSLRCHGRITLIGSTRKRIVHLGSWDVTWRRALKKQRRTHTFVWSEATWTVAVPYGAHIKRTRSGRLRWYNAELPDLPQIGTEIQVANHQCLNTFSGNPWKPNGQRYSSPYCIKWFRT